MRPKFNHGDALHSMEDGAGETLTMFSRMQLELFPFDQISPVELANTFRIIRNSYWQLRNLRGARWGEARARKQYRLVAEHKKRLLMAGVSKREILDYLACCSALT